MDKFIKGSKLAIAIAAASLGIYSAPAMSEDAQLKNELAALKARIESLEKQLQENSDMHTRHHGGENRTAASSWTDRIGLSGLVEVEASAVDSPDGDESDVVLATVELGIDAQINEWVSAHVLVLFEEDDTDPPEIDEGVVSIANAAVTPFYLNAGRMYLPFGNYESNMVSDPLTLEIGEIRESAVQVGFESAGFYGSLFIFNGDTKEQGDDEIDQFGLNIGFAQESENGGLSYDMGLSYINNIADSDALQDAVMDADNLSDQVAGVGAHLIVNAGDFTLIGEYLGASESFEDGDLDFRGRGAEPESWNLELGYHFTMGDWDSTFAIAWQETDEALALELPERRLVAALSMEIFANTSLSLEWANDEDYDLADGGTGDDTDTFTAQLAVEF